MLWYKSKKYTAYSYKYIMKLNFQAFFENQMKN